MKIFLAFLAVLLTIIVSGFIAGMLAIAMAEGGMLGSCFEGACGYAAIYAAFPLLWILISIASISGYVIWRRRRGFRK